MLCVDKVGGEVSFAFHVDYPSLSHAVTHALDHLGSLLSHLEADDAKLLHNEKHDNNKNAFVGTDNDKSEHLS